MKKVLIRKRSSLPKVSILETRHTTYKSLQDLKKIYTSLAEKTNLDPASADVQVLVEKCKKHICDNYYDCDVNMFRELGNLYVNDVRFKENFDKYKPGFAEFLSKAIDTYCMTDAK